jgi:predicted Zn-dependent protease with MMP-like domain
MSDPGTEKGRRRRPIRYRTAAHRRVADWFVVLVEEALDQLPAAFAERVENVVVVVETAPDRITRAEMGLGHGRTLLGLYQGVPLPERSVEAPPLMPDRIVIYQDPILSISHDPDEIKRQVRQTVIHEIGHYFGLSDDEMAELEQS